VTAYGLGDYTVFSDVLTDRSGKPVGTEGGTGLITQISGSGARIFFSMAVQLPGGQVTAQGLSSMAADKQLAITGGAGRDTDARGRLDLVENGDGAGSLTLTLA
jgi:hypothetical protein